jgi:hypothetical protein
MQVRPEGIGTLLGSGMPKQRIAGMLKAGGRPRRERNRCFNRISKWHCGSRRSGDAGGVVPSIALAAPATRLTPAADHLPDTLAVAKA